MITIEDKLDIFYKLVFKNEEENAKLKLEDLEKQHKKILEDKVRELEKIEKENIERRKSLAETLKNEMISKAVGENKHKVLIKREEFLKDRISSIQMKAQEFTHSVEYKKYMINKVTNVLSDLNENDIIIKLNEEDEKKLNKDLTEIAIKNNKNLSFDLLSMDAIGGFIIMDKAKTYNLDNSFKSIIEENKYKIGKELYIALEKTGDLIE